MVHASRMATGQNPAAQAAEPVALVENPQGRSPILLICEHASRYLPDRYGTLGLNPEQLESHIAWDPGALGVAKELSRLLDAPLVHATVSRLVLDLNRDPSAPDSIWTLSERTSIPGNLNLDRDERAHRVREVYEAFHGAVDALIEPRVRAGQTRSVVSIHSFTPVYRDEARPWHIGLIHDQDARFALSVEAGLRKDPELVVGMNEPYSPADRVFHTLERHAVQRGLAPLMIEIRNDLIRTQDGQASWAQRLAPLLREGAQGL
ncbi:N-formylglutamate amidohydrolase [Microvirga guangxiensis]|uniref:Predicted N-formylglutamate amidohydrolase n=1 Tax=Microvirga guangxiensis TaxID=549386 RepID=A0A1G5KXR3_9HYPH|nr:N-formylglutamate amidohydrolase [Microvirga guangxiensis]SCZ04918.1 Predicted N-formylglutamate amidohydrolase [Microvirga guangxiensis]